VADSFIEWALGRMKEAGFPDPGEVKGSHEGSQSQTPKRDANQPVDLNRKKTILPGEPGSTPPGFRGYQ
jgi:hypothetical protein